MDSPVRKIQLLTPLSMPYKMPSSYNISDNTNIYKFLKIIQEEINEFRQACYDVEDIHDLDKKYGKNLDNYASNYDIERKGESDIQFLNKIKSFIYSRGSSGDEDTILRTAAGYFDLEDNAFGINTVDTRKIEFTFPPSVLEAVVEEIVKRVKAAGIRYELTPDRYWSDLNYADPLPGSIASFDYDTLDEYKYERKVSK